MPILCSKALSYVTRGKVYSACVRSVMIYGSECWARRVADTQSFILRKVDVALDEG